MKNSFISKIVDSALNRWESVLSQLNITIPANHKHGACPCCGGKDRFRFDNQQGRGTWICNRCGAGDGLKLIMLVIGCSAYDAAKEVASCLCLSVPESDNYQQKISYQGIQQQVSRLLAQCIDGQSPYLINKGLERFSGVFPVLGNVTVSCGNIEFGAGTAVFPLYNIENQVTGAQLISPNGDKLLLAGSVMKSSYVILQHDPNSLPSQIIITEGIATGFAIADFSQNLSKQSSIFAAISANNLLPVALALRKLYPNVPIIMAGDNDDPQNESKKYW